MGESIRIESPDDIKEIFEKIFDTYFLGDKSIFSHPCDDSVTITTSFKSFPGLSYARIDELSFKVRVCSFVSDDIEKGAETK